AHGGAPLPARHRSLALGGCRDRGRPGRRPGRMARSTRRVPRGSAQRARDPPIHPARDRAPLRHLRRRPRIRDGPPDQPAPRRARGRAPLVHPPWPLGSAAQVAHARDRSAGDPPRHARGPGRGGAEPHDRNAHARARPHEERHASLGNHRSGQSTPGVLQDVDAGTPSRNLPRQLPLGGSVYRLLIGALAAGALMAGPATAQTTTHSTTSKATTTKSTPHAAKSTGAKTAMPGRFFTGKPNAARYREISTRELDLARADLKKLLAVKGKRTVQNTMTLYSSLTLHAVNAGSWAGLMESVHPDSAFRSTAEAMSQDASKFFTELGLNRQLYEAIQAVDVSAADPTTKYLVEKTLRDFRLAGVDKDEATRKQIQAIQDELVLVSQEFDRNIRNDSRKIQVTAAELDGMPDDFMKSHPPGPDGKITLSIEYPDRFPVATYAKNGDVRKRLQFEAMNRAYPANEAVLDSMLDKRYRLARMLGYPTWADYITANKMIENAANAAQFINRIGRLTREQSQREYEVYLKRNQEDVPGATAVNRWEVRYYEQLIRKRDYNFDPSAARPYFPFEGVKKGVLEVTSKLYGVTYKRIQQPDVWDPSVEAYEVYDGKTLLGRFFFDLHPRPGKFNHAAQFNIRTGVTGSQLPEACLVCNFPGGTKGDPG